jgi:hypothetical protein
MSDSDTRNPPWQTLQRRLAEGVSGATHDYLVACKTQQPQWRVAPAGSWLSRARSGVARSRATVA